MSLTPFHALYKARMLSNYASGSDKLIPAFAAANIEVFPYQVASCLFALRSPYQKGVMLCDEGGLGKTFLGLLIIAQKWYEGKEKILIVVPTQLLHQWIKIIDTMFSIPCVSVDNNIVFNKFIKNGYENPFLQEASIITTYDFAADKADFIEQIDWNVTIFDEAHRLRRIYTGENKGSLAIQKAVSGSFKVLLTATPMQNSIMDLYGLINFIDETVFTDEKTFYSRYFRRPENYEELANRVSKYCFRTLRSQVKKYVKIPERIPITSEFVLTEKEQVLYSMLEKYLARVDKKAFPKMDSYDLTLMLFRTFSSSTFAIAETLKGIVERLKRIDYAKDELSQVKEMLALAVSIKENAKGNALLNALETGFVEISKLGANKKTLIFTENRATQKYLYKLLNIGKYKNKVLIFNGDYSRDYEVMENFKSKADILITTDLANEGFDLSFCSFIVNYDMPYNTQKVEQRINRCHRLGQQSDVIVLNFVNRNNFADVRMLELINKRVLQFDGIFGSTDDIIGNFTTDLSQDFSEILATARTKSEIDTAFENILKTYEKENTKLVETAEHSLYTTFNKQIADSITITPQYIKDKTKEINDDLWELTKYFFEGVSGYVCDDETRTVNIGITPKKMFTGGHLGRREYSMTDKTLPKSGWHMLGGTLAKNILAEIFWRGTYDSGSIQVDSGELKVVSCKIAFYEIKVKAANEHFYNWRYYVFVGKTASGEFLDDKQCKEIMALPVLQFTKEGETFGDRDGTLKEKKSDELDEKIKAEEFLEKTFTQANVADNEEIEKMKAHTMDLKFGLERNLDTLRGELKTLNNSVSKVDSIAEKLKAEKHKTIAGRELKIKEQTLFMDGVKLEVELEEKIKEMVANAKLTAKIKREFIIQIIPKQ